MSAITVFINDIIESMIAYNYVDRKALVEEVFKSFSEGHAYFEISGGERKEGTCIVLTSDAAYKEYINLETYDLTKF